MYRPRKEFSRGDDYLPAPRFGTRRNSFFYGFGIVRLSVRNRPKIGNIKIVVGKFEYLYLAYNFVRCIKNGGYRFLFFIGRGILLFSFTPADE